MPIQLKICGLTSLADARFCAGAGVDYLGFVFHRESARFIEPARVREIADWLHGPELVGVFVDEAPDNVNRVAEEAGLTVVQLHGDEPPDTCDLIERPIIKAIRVADDDTAASVRSRMEPYRSVARYFLLDTFRPDVAGGTGRAFNWSIAAELAAEFPLFLSGGLTSTNIEEAAKVVRPTGVDLSSGVESAPGVKDFDLLGAFFDRFAALRDARPAFPSDHE